MKTRLELQKDVWNANHEIMKHDIPYIFYGLCILFIVSFLVYLIYLRFNGHK
jgi:hypothetical protein